MLDDMVGPALMKRPAAAAAGSIAKKAKGLHEQYASKASYASSMAHKARKEALANNKSDADAKAAGAAAYKKAIAEWGE